MEKDESASKDNVYTKLVCRVTRQKYVLRTLLKKAAASVLRVKGRLPVEPRPK